MFRLDFETANKWLDDIEGIRSDDKQDPGGLTKWGIASASYPEVLRPDFSYVDAVLIRKRDFWDRCHCGEIESPGLALMLFDAKINQTGSAVRNIQLTVGANPDNVIGPNTIAKINQANAREALVDFFARRMVSYSEAPVFKADGHGLGRRLALCLLEAVRLEELNERS